MTTATAQAAPNIAFIKYWGNRNAHLRLPANGSISMNLGGLFTRTQVTIDPALSTDSLTINERPATGAALRRVAVLMERVRLLAGIGQFAAITSTNNFPAGAGIASSASAFAALSLAAASAAGVSLSEKDLSRLARTGSGSACRSVPGGFVEWQAGNDDLDSYAYSISPPKHWELVDCIVVVNEAHKPTGSTEGHRLAVTSPLQAARVADASRRLAICRQAILDRDFEALAEISELDCNLMHAVMMTSSPYLIYWQAVTLEVIHAVQAWRRSGVPVFYTIDAGPNVHALCPGDQAPEVAKGLAEIPGVMRVLVAPPGGPAFLVPELD
jgi:diphosphomevalonate decarboxylase